MYTKCECKSLSPATAVADFSNLLLDSNLDEVFGADGLKALASFQFYYSIIFYTFTIFTILWIYWLFDGRRRDLEDIKKGTVEDNIFEKLEEEQKDKIGIKTGGEIQIKKRKGGKKKIK